MISNIIIRLITQRSEVRILSPLPKSTTYKVRQNLQSPQVSTFWLTFKKKLLIVASNQGEKEAIMKARSFPDFFSRFLCVIFFLSLLSGCTALTNNVK